MLDKTIGTKEEENISNANATFWLTVVTSLYFLLSIMELIIYLFYNYKVKHIAFFMLSRNIFYQAHPWKEIIQETKDSNKGPFKGEKVFDNSVELTSFLTLNVEKLRYFAK